MKRRLFLCLFSCLVALGVGGCGDGDDGRAAGGSCVTASCVLGDCMYVCQYSAVDESYDCSWSSGDWYAGDTCSDLGYTRRCPNGAWYLPETVCP
ncbi:MAG: hypothetical protein GYA57_08880 [Myxococcales bacterium]|nr:hypothetical protein [Myxococcales bacterium]